MNLSEKYPDFWKESVETVQIIEAFGTETQALRGAAADMLAQCNVRTATWGLDLWEKQLGLESFAEKPLDFRRARILAKLRGTGTVTVAMIQKAAESFSNGKVAILEDAANYRFEIKFVGTVGIPPNMDDLTSAINEMKPAHLAYGYIYVFNTYADLAMRTNTQLATQTYAQLREGRLT